MPVIPTTTTNTLMQDIYDEYDYWAVTLTHLPGHAGDFTDQEFEERLIYKLNSSKVKVSMVREYHKKTKIPHYHAIVQVLRPRVKNVPLYLRKLFHANFSNLGYIWITPAFDLIGWKDYMRKETHFIVVDNFSYLYVQEVQEPQFTKEVFDIET